MTERSTTARFSGIEGDSGRAPFLDGFASIHSAMRRDAGRLAGAVERVRTAREAARLARWFGHFSAAIEAHHRREDDVVWPDLTARSPSFAAERSRLEFDHAALDDALARTGIAVRALVDDPMATDRAVASTLQLAALLEDHLDREELAAFGRLSQVHTPESYAEMERRMIAAMSVRNLAFEMPWAMDGLDPVDERTLLRGVPGPIRVAYRIAFRPRYRRLCRPLHSSDPANCSRRTP